MDKIEENITSEDKTLSMLCHLSMVIGGIIMPIIIWAIKKEQSKFVRFHSLQSIFFHLVFAVILAVAIVVFAVIIVLAGAGISSVKYLHDPAKMSGIIIIISFAFLGIITLAAFGGIGYSIYLAVKSYQGEKTRIPILGKIIYEKIYGKL
jgi:uncharacterized Tic20 family protein